MTDEEKVQLVARALCVAEGIEPDTLIHRGMPLMVKGNLGYAARRLDDAKPYWTFKCAEALAAIEILATAEQRLVSATTRKETA